MICPIASKSPMFSFLGSGCKLELLMQNSTIELCRSLFKRATTGPAWTNPAANPMVVLCDITPSDLRHILHFMYNGEVEVKQANLNTFLAVAERLRVRGLCQSGGKTSPSPPSAPPGQTRSPPPHEVDRRRSASPSPQTSSSKQISTGQRRCSLGKVHYANQSSLLARTGRD